MSLCIFVQAAELAEFTAKIALLEEAKRKKDEEASEWQHKVRLECVCVCVCLCVRDCVYYLKKKRQTISVINSLLI